MLLTRGTSVVAEAVIKNDVLERLIGVNTKTVYDYRQVRIVGDYLAAPPPTPHTLRTASPPFSSPPGRTSPTSRNHTQRSRLAATRERRLLLVATLAGLIVGTYGGGTALPTQRECLELLGCYGKGKAHKLAEICAGTTLAGEISLASAVLARNWVNGRERLGRNREAEATATGHGLQAVR